MVDLNTGERRYVMSLLGYRFYTDRDSDWVEAFFESVVDPDRESEIYESYGIREPHKLITMREVMFYLFHNEFTTTGYDKLGFSAVNWHNYFLSSSEHKQSYQCGCSGRYVDEEFMEFVESKLNDIHTKKIERYASMIWKCSKKA